MKIRMWKDKRWPDWWQLEIKRIGPHNKKVSRYKKSWIEIWKFIRYWIIENDKRKKLK